MITLAPLLDQVSNELWRVLKIGGNDHGRGAARLPQACEKGGMAAEIARETKAFDARVFLRKMGNDIKGFVGAAVIDKNDFRRDVQPIKDIDERFVENLDIGFLVVDRNDNRKNIRGFYGSPPIINEPDVRFIHEFDTADDLDRTSNGDTVGRHLFIHKAVGADHGMVADHNPFAHDGKGADVTAISDPRRFSFFLDLSARQSPLHGIVRI